MQTITKEIFMEKVRRGVRHLPLGVVGPGRTAARTRGSRMTSTSKRWNWAKSMAVEGIGGVAVASRGAAGVGNNAGGLRGALVGN